MIKIRSIRSFLNELYDSAIRYFQVKTRGETLSFVELPA